MTVWEFFIQRILPNFPFVFVIAAKHNPALTLTLEEAYLTLEGRDLPTMKKKTWTWSCRRLLLACSSCCFVRSRRLQFPSIDFSPPTDGLDRPTTVCFCPLVTRHLFLFIVRIPFFPFFIILIFNDSKNIPLYHVFCWSSAPKCSHWFSYYYYNYYTDILCDYNSSICNTHAHYSRCVVLNHFN